LIAAGDFPRPISPTQGTKAWPMSAVQSWIQERTVVTPAGDGPTSKLATELRGRQLGAPTP
jgi:hypothetical protein